ncbi:MAG: MFS transporter [Lentisphaerae bacterium]|nr:MFS transporter [Lentisphaerota bacterium]
MSAEVDPLPRSCSWLNVAHGLGVMGGRIFLLLIVLQLMEHQHTLGLPAAYANAMILLGLPFLLLSNAAGVLTDRASKRLVICRAKLLEIAIMAAGCLSGFWRHPPALYALLFLFGAQRALLAPATFAVIPELVKESQLARANGLLMGVSGVAIALGAMLPASAMHRLAWPLPWLSGLCLAFAIAGYAAARRLPDTPPAGPPLRASPLFLIETVRTLRRIRHDRYALLTVFALAYVFLFAGFLHQNLLLYGREHLALNGLLAGGLFPLAALGLAFGALAAGRLSAPNIEFGIVPVGAVGASLACLMLGFITPRLGPVCALLTALGFFAGLLLVPLLAFLQHRCPPAQRGQILAAGSVLCALGFVMATLLVSLLCESCHLPPRTSFLLMGLLTALLAIAAGKLLPDFLVRFVGVIITRGLYRIRAHGAEHLPLDGPALLVSNHVTWADPVLLSVLTQRRIRFVMSREIMERHWLRPVFRIMNAIPISSDDPPRRIIAALQAARAALDDGYLVCIFAEGALTRNGNLRAFRPGLERIMKGSNYPIIPIYIGGAWGSIFSYYHGRLLSSLPKTLPYPIWLVIGPPMPASSSSAAVRQAIAEISGTAYDMRKQPSRTLADTFVRTARKFWSLPAISDTSGRRLTFGRALAGAIALSRALEVQLRGQDRVGILLPASVGGALTNIAVTLTGRVPVNLNFTVAREAVQIAITQGDLRTVISSRAFLKKIEGFEAPPGTLYLEDLMPRITPGQKLRALAAARFLPAAQMMTHRRSGPDDLATIIFSSGSTGIPKGVMLTHHNILSNIESFGSVFGFEHTDRVCAILPLFHSFGFTATLWCPLVLGFNSHFHPNPMDAAKIAEIVRTERLTILMSTPTFLLSYIRKANRDDFASLRCVVTGAEKLKPRVADAFEDRFGLRPQEGYGTTELSPVVGVNLADVTLGEVSQIGTKPNSIGHPIPGVAVRIVDPETGAPLGAMVDGLLQVKGPNVMRGYLADPEKTAAVMHDGWYDTGDIAHVDEDGFVFIVDRLSRFSKIGGEMVPHLAIEERLQEALQLAQPAVAVTAVTDERKGEQLVVLFTPAAGEPDVLRRILRESDLPNLWKPREDNFLRIDSLPMLGSGKLDIRRVKDMAKGRISEREGRS